jgi:MT-A70
MSHPWHFQGGGLVALWMTNRERHWRFVERELLPGWGLQPVASWLWLKAADDGRPVAPLVSAHLFVAGQLRRLSQTTRFWLVLAEGI